MAKKKKQTRKKPKEEVVEKERSAFWAISGSVFLMIIGIFLLLGMFGTGGTLPTGMYGVVYGVLGFAAVLAPVAAVYWGYLKFRHEERRIPLSKLMGMTLLIISVASLMHVVFASKEELTGSYTGGNGGGLGEVAGGAVLSALDKVPAAIMFFVIAMFSFFWTFGISPKILLKPFERKEKNDTDLEDLKTTETGLKLNEGVPVVHHRRESPSKSPTIKNTVQKVAPVEAQTALTAASDPDWIFPDMKLLNQKQDKADAGDIQGNADIIKDTFTNFNLDVEMEGANIGPRITQYTMRPPTGVKLTKITALENNLALDLAATSIRMEAPIPGKRLVGIEVPNIKSATVTIHGILNSREWQSNNSPLGFAVGKGISGAPVVADLEDMPHLLIAGQTKSGKSVMINTLLGSLLYRNSPSDLKLILIDPKHVEMAPYEDIPHLIAPVITEAEKSISALKWTVAEMERRLKTFAEVKQRDIQGYNRVKKDEGMPYIVVVIDELADLMMMAARDVEALIVRIAQKARAAGIHLVLATQRPDASTVTGLIKANVPARIAFAVQDQINSRIIIDSMGAEKLLGKGDMLYKTTDIPRPIRIQGALITGDETNKLCDFLRMQRPPSYNEDVMSQPVQLNGRGGIVADYGGQDADDDMYKDAVRAVIEGNKASTSLLQRRLRIGYGRAARMIETMEEQGIISSADGNKPREVLVSSLDEVFGGGDVVEANEDEFYDENFPEENRGK
jgi:S-DNA-T family DNA segregation ATPase FtsK/SpoIIIE